MNKNPQSLGDRMMEVAREQGRINALLPGVHEQSTEVAERFIRLKNQLTLFLSEEALNVHEQLSVTEMFNELISEYIRRTPSYAAALTPVVESCERRFEEFLDARTSEEEND